MSAGELWLVAQTHAAQSPWPQGVQGWVVTISAVITPLITLLVVYRLLGVKVPEERRRRDIALDMLKLFLSDGMVESRQSAWVFLSRLDGHPATLEERLDLFWRMTLAQPFKDVPENSPLRDAAIRDGLVSLRRILDFLGVCEENLANNLVDRRLMKTFLRHMLHRWIHRFLAEIIFPKMPPDIRETLRCTNNLVAKNYPSWITGLPRLKLLLEEGDPKEPDRSLLAETRPNRLDGVDKES